MHQLIESRQDCGVDALIERDHYVERKDCGKDRNDCGIQSLIERIVG